MNQLIRVDQETTSYQIALKMVDLIENTIKEKLRKNVLSDYDIEALTDIFFNCLNVGKLSDLKQNQDHKYNISYCVDCGSSKGCNCKSQILEI